MKLIGKQIVVELPEKFRVIDVKQFQELDEDEYSWEVHRRIGFNQALSSTACMNQAWEVDVKALSKEIQKYFGTVEVQPDDITKFDVAKTAERIVNWGMTSGLAYILASNPSAWLKRKE